MSEAVTLRCNVNGSDVDREVDARLLLVEFVRDVLGLKATRVGCHTGDCGACTLLLDGAVVKSCLVLALSAEERAVVTIEGSNNLAEIQAAFVAENGFQCGYCTTGMILTAAELLNKSPHPSDMEIRHALVGNLCRCTGYDAIIAAIHRAAERRGSVGYAVGSRQ
ncbi:(2Fe-2S)-binding protein [Roseomonas populi]|uniref:(2Fe-2S)-binding protein n=1 Tax=Roseomonas populi TaxID=3121582 RepID=A0ABT1X9S5_9PROT|nr:(2Fe-2S)-binding protein [Roseomonas pecuniae]MCR0984863.1 (2Fe-2S)-binding protein [Roseomonas pecuniae]